jgi:hypothetical protein
MRPTSVAIRGDEFVYEGSWEQWERHTLPEELVLRDLFRVDIEDVESVRDFLAAHGRTRGADHDLAVQFPAERVACEEVSHTLRVTRALVRHWHAYQSKKAVADAWDAEGLSVDDARGAWMSFAHYLNTGLGGHHPYFRYSARVSSDEGPLAVGATEAPAVDLYTALCLQLLNVIVEEIPPRECANEPCPNLFVRQTGGAQYGQYRTRGVVYCSPSCARAQAERERRRRNRKDTR